MPITPFKGIQKISWLMLARKPLFFCPVGVLRHFASVNQFLLVTFPLRNLLGKTRPAELVVPSWSRMGKARLRIHFSLPAGRFRMRYSEIDHLLLGSALQTANGTVSI